MELLTFGETMLRLSPPHGERLETTGTLDVRVGGAESNVAVVAARLGLAAGWCSKVHDSPLGHHVVGELRRHGVAPHVTWTDEGRLGTYYLEHGGEPRGTTVVYDRADASVTTATPGELDTPFATCDWFYTSGITPALSETLSETTGTLLEQAAAAGVTTAFDVNYRSKLWSPERARETITGLFEYVDLLVCAERDAREVLDRDGDPTQIATGLANAHDIATTVITRGEQGALAFSDGRIVEQPTYDADTADPVGTGDAFVGGLLARLAHGGTLDEAMADAAAAAALKRTIAGDLGVISPGEVERVVEESTDGIDR